MAEEFGIYRTQELQKITVFPEPLLNGAVIENVRFFKVKADRFT
jgi:hypothetical protein